jgi:dTMP kinase
VDTVRRAAELVLQKWLESEGYCTYFSGWNSWPLVRDVTRRGKRKRMLTPMTFSLIHATDFADRSERHIVPPLKARAIVRGAEPQWVKGVYEFALKPDIVIYLRADVEQLVRRVVQTTGFNYWESGMDLNLGDDMYDSVLEYQGRLMAIFDGMSLDYAFHVIETAARIEDVGDEIKNCVEPLFTADMGA